MNNYKNYPLPLRLGAIVLGSLFVAALAFFIIKEYSARQTDQGNKNLARIVAVTANNYLANLEKKTTEIAINPELANQYGATIMLQQPAAQEPSATNSYLLKYLFEKIKTASPEPAAVNKLKEQVIYTGTMSPNQEVIILQWSAHDLKKQILSKMKAGQSVLLQQVLSDAAIPVIQINQNKNSFRPYTQNLKYLSWNVVTDQPASNALAIFVSGLTLLIGLGAGGSLILGEVLSHRRLVKKTVTIPEQHLTRSDVDSLLDIELPPLPTSARASKPKEGEEKSVFDTPFENLNAALRTHTITKPSQPARSKNIEAPDSTAISAEEELPPSIEETLGTSLDALSNTIEFSLEDFSLPDNINEQQEDLKVTQIPPSLFRAYDIRGSVDLLTKEVIYACGRALGAKIAKEGLTEVVLGYDARLTSREYAAIISETLVESGLRVIELGLIPTPVMYFAARIHQGNGIMVTASHSALNFNGLKWIIDNKPPTPEDIKEIYELAFYKGFTTGEGLLINRTYTKEYLTALTEELTFARSFRMVIDGMNGSMGPLAAKVFEDLNCEVIELSCDPDATFPRGAPDPSNPAMLENICQAVIEHQADMGLVFDGDGDRLVVIDSEGQQVPPDQLIALLARLVLETSPGTDVVYDVKCSRLVSTTITENGGRPIMIRTGSTFLRRAVLDNPDRVTLAAEYAGHIVFNDGRGQFGDDGLCAALRLIEWLSWQPETLADLCKAFPKTVGTNEIAIPVEDENLHEMFEAIHRQLEVESHDGTISTVDGLRVDTLNGFGLIRASNTGAFLSARFDATANNHLDDIIEQFAKLIEPHSFRMATQLRFNRL